MILFTIIQFFIPAVVWASPGTPYSMNYGFLEGKTATLPAAVKAKQKNIFAILIPDYSSANADQYGSLLGGNTKVSSEGQQDLMNCQKAKLPFCLYRNGMLSRATGFLLEDGKSFWTCAHVVAQWFSYFKQTRLIESDGKITRRELELAVRSQEIPLAIMDSPTHFLETSLENKAVLESFVLNQEKESSNVELSWVDDAVGIHFTRDLHKDSLHLAKAINEKHDVSIFAGGFPYKTQTRKSLGRGDSDGQKFYWSTGKSFWNKDKVLSEMALRIGKSAENYAFLKSYGMFISADASPGMSGSPIMNAAGEVVGMINLIITQSEQNSGADVAPVLVRGLNLDGLKFVNHF